MREGERSMIEPDLDYFQDIQDVYTYQTKLQCMIVNKDGNPITQIVDEKLFHLVLENESLREGITRWTSIYSNISGPVLFDLIPGIKGIISPIYLKGKIQYYIIAGSFIECSTWQVVKSYLEMSLNTPGSSQQLLSIIKEYSASEIKDKIKKIKKMSDLIEGWLKTQHETNMQKNQETITNSILQLIESDDVSVLDLLQLFYQSYSSVDFVGYARKNGEDYFIIEECISSYANTLKCSVFTMGEGILGQSIVTQTVGFWEQINVDPRNVFFHQRGIYPTSLFCFPIIHGKEVIGLFFGGSNNKEPLKKEIKYEGKLISSLIKGIESKMLWQTQAKDNLMKMTILNELFHAIMSVQDVKRILFIILDMSINLIRAPFASVIIQHPLHKKFEIVSRGLNGDKIDQYYQDITNRLFNNHPITPDLSSLKATHLTNLGMRVVEIPISYNNRCYGYLSIGISEVNLAEDNLSFLKSLAVAGGIAIHLLEVSNRSELDQPTINILTELQEYNDPEYYKKAMKAKEIISGFKEYWSNKKIDFDTLKYTATLLSYEEQFLSDKIKNQVIIDSINEYRLVEKEMVELSEASLNVQLLVLVWNYLDGQENIHSFSKVDGINSELLNEFISYLSRFNIIEREISFADHNLLTYEPKINKSLNLSKREMDVVKLVVQGNNNREIAENLYISEHTVKNHMTSIFSKLEVNDRSQVIAKIYQTGFHPGDVS